MANVWTPEAERLTPSGTSGDLKGGGAKAILHVTVSPSGGSNFDAMHRVLISKQGEPHYLYDPVTDRLGQYFPLNRSSRSLVMGSGPVSCNRAGDRVIQIEVVAWPGTVDGAYKDGAPTTKGGFTSLWKPGPNFRAMMRDIRANGVPDRFPMGSTAPGCPRASFSSYQSGSGWYGHGQIPYQTHWDPGLIDQAAFFAAANTTTAPTAPTGGLSMADINTITAQLDALKAGVADTLKKADGATLRADTGWQNNMIETNFAALTAAVQALASVQGVDASEIASVVDKAVRDRLSQIKITDAPA